MSADPSLQYPCGGGFVMDGQECRSRKGAVVRPHRYRLAYGPVYTVACPSCGAAVMELCRSRAGTPVAHHHMRLLAARGSGILLDFSTARQESGQERERRAYELSQESGFEAAATALGVSPRTAYRYAARHRRRIGED